MKGQRSLWATVVFMAVLMLVPALIVLGMRRYERSEKQRELARVLLANVRTASGQPIYDEIRTRIASTDGDFQCKRVASRSRPAYWPTRIPGPTSLFCKVTTLEVRLIDGRRLAFGVTQAPEPPYHLIAIVPADAETRALVNDASKL